MIERAGEIMEFIFLREMKPRFPYTECSQMYRSAAKILVERVIMSTKLMYHFVKMVIINYFAIN